MSCGSDPEESSSVAYFMLTKHTSANIREGQTNTQGKGTWAKLRVRKARCRVGNEASLVLPGSGNRMEASADAMGHVPQDSPLEPSGSRFHPDPRTSW